MSYFRGFLFRNSLLLTWMAAGDIESHPTSFLIKYLGLIVFTTERAGSYPGNVASLCEKGEFVIVWTRYSHVLVQSTSVFFLGYSCWQRWYVLGIEQCVLPAAEMVQYFELSIIILCYFIWIKSLTLAVISSLGWRCVVPTSHNKLRGFLIWI